MTVTFVLLIALSAYAALAGSGATRLFGFFGVVFFGLGGAWVLALTVVPPLRRSPAGKRFADWRESVRQQRERANAPEIDVHEEVQWTARHSGVEQAKVAQVLDAQVAEVEESARAAGGEPPLLDPEAVARRTPDLDPALVRGVVDSHLEYLRMKGIAVDADEPTN